MKKKNRVEKAIIYEDKYKDIPRDYEERLSWMCDKYKLSENKMISILEKRRFIMNTLFYTDLIIILYEEPEGSPRPRFRLINRHNFINEAMTNSNFVHVYSLNAKEDNMYMQRIVQETDLINLQQMIYTPCIVEYNTFQKTPLVFNVEDIFLSEIGLIRPITKPDWDNICKKYSDMSNHNLWLDDTLVVSGTINKFYSILPRVEIKIKYLNTLYNKYQYNSISKRLPDQQIDYIKFK